MRSPVFPVSFTFSDTPCKRFLRIEFYLRKNTFSSNVNPSLLARGHELKANTSQKSLAAIETLNKESLAQNLGNLTLINYSHKNVVANF